MSITSTKITISPVNLGGHVGLAINGEMVERQMTRTNGTSYWVAESYSNLKEIRVAEIDDRWPMPFINGISIDGVITVRIGTKIINNTNIGITYSNCDVATYSATDVTEECFRHCGQTVRRLYRNTPNSVSRYVPLRLNIDGMFEDSVLKEYKKIEGFTETLDKAFDIVETETTYRVYGWGNNPDMYTTFMKDCAMFEVGGHGNRFDKPTKLSPFKLY